ncbi:putative acyltransferase [Andreesenia angusta]|uniref:Putative acyltransferase n=1 Tax=Andreesenia angusta TaxID=39480 RepID=A0A1S1VB80_9FIRM|nr:GNAT family N-acetyltransferase [Andreesenia angusta]OHW63477.1 putative acyltransferase [Andreesenia angusta]
MYLSIKKFDELSTRELYDILKKREEVFIVEQKCPYPDCDGKDLESYHMLYKDGEKLVGYLRILPKGLSYDEISLGRILIDSSYREQKLGSRMVKKALEFVETVLCENRVRISAQLYLLNFYSSLGFESVGSPYEEDWIPHIEMLYKKED